MHDDLQQTLASIKIDITSAAELSLTDLPQVVPLLNATQQHADAAIFSTRRIINDLRPQILDDLGLIPALKALASQFTQRTGIDCTVCAQGFQSEDAMPSSLDTCLFRVAQEALNNVIKHARARHA